MRRSVVFGKGRSWRAEDDRYQDLHLGPRRGARVGEYAPPEPNEYSDSYYAPANAFERRSFASSGYMRGDYGIRPRTGPRVGGVVGNPPSARPTDHGSYGDLHAGESSWADIGASSVHAGESGLTETARPSYRGRGPKGYVRSDERLLELVCERLTEDPWLDASDVSVDVKNGEVTLSGTVGDRRAKRRAEQLADACAPDAQIHNRLRTRTREHLPLG